MEEAQMDEEPEKMSTKHRRSSILKIPKNRNPFGEVDLAETCAETTLMKTTRRVSFASSNLVKPFVADPDRNTIWDTTYEEEINHTDSTQSSQEQSNKINSTLFGTLKSTISVSMSVSAIDMDITKGALSIDKENIPQQPRISIVDYAKKLSTNSVVPLYSLPSHNESERMEFTCQNLDPFMTLNGVGAGVSEMELTELAANVCDEITNKSFFGAMEESLPGEMDFTCQVPVSISGDTEIPNGKLSRPEETFAVMDFTCQDKEVSKTDKSGGGDMDFTCQIPWKVSDEPSNVEKFFSNNMELTCQLPRTCQSVEVSKAEKSISMELTCQIPSTKLEILTKLSKTDESSIGQLLTKCQNNEVSKSDKSVNHEMELTCQISTVNLGKDSRDVSKVEKSVVDDMEFTCQLPTDCRINEVSKPEQSTNCDVELSCQKPTLNLTPKADKSIGNDMEFTCQLPTKCPNIEVSNLEKSCANNMEFTCQLLPVCQISEVSEPQKSGDCDMEFTCQIPPPNGGKVYDEMSKRDISTANEMEFTCQLPTKCQNSEASDYMEFTCQVPAAGLEQACHNKSGTCQLPTVCQANEVAEPENAVHSDMDFICQIPPSDMRRRYGMSKTDKSIAADMDFTCQIPLNERTSCTDAQFSYQIPKQKSDDTVMEFVRQIPHDRDFSCQIPNLEMTTVSVDGHQMSNFDYIGKQSESEKASLVNNQTDPQNSLKLSRIDVNVQRWFADPIPTAATRTPVKSSKIPIKSPTIQKNLAREDAEVINKDESVLDLTCTSPIKDEYPSKRILYSQKIPTNLKLLTPKHSYSDLKTPEPSFLINLTNFSSGVDDTQHLLHCTYTKPLPDNLIASRFDCQECTCANAQEIGDVSVPKLTNFSQCNVHDVEIDDVRTSSGSQDMTLSDFKRNKLTTVNDTYVLARKGALKNRTFQNGESVVRNTYTLNNEQLEHDSSLGFLDEDQLVLPDNILGGKEIKDKDLDFLKIEQTAEAHAKEKDVEMSPVVNRPEIQLKEFKFTIKRVGKLSHLMERIEKRRRATTEFLENFRLKEIHVPEEFIITEQSSEESELSVEKSIKTVEDNHPTVGEKIRKRQKSSQNAWKLEKVDDEFYHFSTLFGTLTLVVQLDLENGTVRTMERKSNLADDTDPKGLYIMKLFLDKLDDSHIKAAIGGRFDVLSLLDYIEMTMVKLFRLQEDLINCSRLALTKDCIAKFSVISVPLTLICEISLDVSDLENLNFDDVKVCTRKGVVNDNELKKYIKNCPKGYQFFKEFAHCIDEYLATKGKRKKFAKRNL